MPEDQGVADRIARPLDDAVSTNPHLRCGLAARCAVPPEQPAGAIPTNVSRRASLVVAVVPLAQVVGQLGGKTRELRRTPCALQRGRQDERKRMRSKNRSQASRALLASRGQRQICPARVLSGHAPLGLAVPDQPDLLTHVCRCAR